jgi:peptide/nickel transport system ATP-binding protein
MGIVARALNHFGARNADEVVTAVNGVTLSIPRGSVYGLVGESGCGKSTLGRIAAGLLRPSAGQVRFEGARIDAGAAEVPAALLLRTQMVFQNPMASLNPRQRVVDIVSEAAVYHGLVEKADRVEFAAGLLAEVGLSREALFRLPHQFSGGQRQRLGIARALSVSPDFLVCDEPIAALDVSIQAQILNLLSDLRKTRGLTMLFISHDLGVVHYLCDKVGVMYLGRIVESAPAPELFAHPRHPYTQALLEQIPSMKTGRRQYRQIVGEIPSPLSPPSGCHFHPRCPHAMDICRREAPAETVEGRHRFRCWLN